ncbi:MAG TPA: tetratricopeptide repeat protein [Pyrinomonadaceae bacterium]|nr:tetratricopeptide repeat protein [Pyrinomonadaceae bacterium]
MKILHPQIKVLLQELFRFECRGEYKTALAAVGNFWEDINSMPDVEGLSSFEAAELFLRCGSLIGFEGQNKNIPKTQEISKNLLTEARHRFIKLGNIEKIAECENYLALAYWRSGELVESETWLEQAFLHDISESHNIRLYSKIIKSLILLSHKKYREIIQTLSGEERNFLISDNEATKGSFYVYFALAHQELGETSKALKYVKLGKLHHQKSGNRNYLGAIENNLAQLYKLERNFAEAHLAIDRATEIFKSINDRTREGFSLDTKAQIYFDEGKYRQALIAVEAALAIMESCENRALLVETFWTKTKILIYLNDVSTATQSLFEAVQIANVHISEESGKNLMKDFELELFKKNSPKIDDIFVEKERDEETFELILPPSLAHYGDVQGVRINNSYLEKYDLPKGSLAIAVKEKIKRGDLVAIIETATDSVICGFYDADFGIVCLENGAGEPTLFDESDIKILGKIIGVCSEEKNSDGKLPVKPLVFSR